MKEIQLTQGAVAKIDDGDYCRIAAYKWYYIKNNRHGGYAVRSETVSYDPYRRRRVWMHHEIYGPIPFGYEIDHVDVDGTNNQKSNLRLCNRSQNACNGHLRSDNQYGTKGIRYHAPNGKYQARVIVNGRRVSLGYYFTVEEAARAYDLAARLEYGEFARPRG